MVDNEKDGMRYPSIDKLTEITHSKYRLIVAAAKRANDLLYKEGVEPLIENPRSVKKIGIALEEVVQGKIEIVEATDEEKSDDLQNNDNLESEEEK